LSEQLSLESGETAAEVGATACRLMFPPTLERPWIAAGHGPSLSYTTWETQINPQVFRLSYSEKFTCLQLTWEMELLLFSNNSCPCTRRKGLQGGLLADMVSELALKREVRAPLAPCHGSPTSNAKAGSSEVGHSLSRRLLSSPQSNQH